MELWARLRLDGNDPSQPLEKPTWLLFLNCSGSLIANDQMICGNALSRVHCTSTASVPFLIIASTYDARS